LENRSYSVKRLHFRAPLVGDFRPPAPFAALAGDVSLSTTIMSSNKKTPTAKNPTTASAASRIQSTQAKAGNDAGKGSFPARVQSAAATNINKGVVSETSPASAAKGAGGRKSPTKGARK